NLVAISADDGSKLWETKGGGGFHAPMDVFVIDGRVWLGDHPRDSVAPPPVNDFNVARDLRTGKVSRKNQIMVDLQTSGHHHRCYREKATDRYIITGKRGFEMMDLRGDEHSRNNWVRGTCQYGMLPANGLVYAPPHSCGCYMESMLKGFWALASERPVAENARRGSRDAARLVKGPAYGRVRGGASAADESWPQFRHDALRSGVAGTELPERLGRKWKAEIGGRLTQPVIAGGKVLVAAADEGVVHALDARTGRSAWDYVAGGRVDSPPAVHGGLALLGSADGRVHCLRLSDGELVWRFLAAPADLRTVAMDRVESVWPVHGSVLVHRGVAYCSAGRSTWIDGGIDLYGLDPATGRVVHRTTLVSRHPKLKEGEDRAKKEHVSKRSQNTTDYKTFLQPDLSDSFSMAGGSVSDVLVSDGANVYLHQVKFDSGLKRRPELSRHLLSTSSLLDPTENHRSHWVLGTGDFSRVPVAYSWVTNRGGWGGRKGVGIGAPMGVMMIYEDDAAWVVKRKGGANGRYALARVTNKPFSPAEKSLPDFRTIPKGQGVKVVWQKDVPVRPRAMLKSGDRLYLGVMPVAIPGDDPHAAYEGRLGGAIWVVSAGDGTKSAEHKLTSPVVWDGMAAADGALFLSTEKGEVERWGGE
ncbi:MAG: outer membrane protein assembly factor BamB family protein, partial [Planctomycetota bacterium]